MIEITIPKLGLTMENAKIVSWQLKPGDLVKKDDIILIIETDKVTFEVPSPGDGIILPLKEEGEILPVGEVVGFIAKDKDEYEQLVEKYSIRDSSGETIDEKTVSSAADDAIKQKISSKREGRIKASPLARSMAKKHGIDLADIKGTGPGGRIVRADILRVLEGRKREPVHIAPLKEEKSEKEIIETIPIKGVRRVIYDNMYKSLSESAQLTLHTEGSAEALISLRTLLGRRGEKVSYNAILIKIVATALREHPNINVSVDKENIVVWKDINIGLAIDTPEGLIVPVIRDADKKGIREIEKNIQEFIQKARENALLPDDISNGTFTISNLGFADIDHFTPIIRPPESAILGVGRILKKPSVKNDEVITEHRMGLSLTFDHRIIDGAPAARFLKSIKDIIEEPLLIIS